jgi:hypothetical protein
MRRFSAASVSLVHRGILALQHSSKKTNRIPPQNQMEEEAGRSHFIPSRFWFGHRRCFFATDAAPPHRLFGAVLVAGISFLHYSQFTLDTGYGHYAMARALQGLAYAFFFLPPSVIAYSQLKRNENNKASSLTRFFRNWGSFGIAFVNTVSDRRLNFHQDTVGNNLPSSNPALQQQVQQVTAFVQERGYAHANAAAACLCAQLQAQAHQLAFMDCFHRIGILTLVAASLVLATGNFQNLRRSPRRTLKQESVPQASGAGSD